MDLQLSGKRALVSGSTAGIGLAIATALAREGARGTLNGSTAARGGAGPAGVLVGPTRSEGVEQFVADMEGGRGVTEKQVEEDFFKSVRPSSLIKRFETSEEVAAVVAFLCSPVASAINGAAVRAEGGVLKGIL